MTSESANTGMSKLSQISRWWRKNKVNAAVWACFLAIIGWSADNIWDSHQYAQRHEISVLKERVDRFEYLSSEFNNAMAMFTMTVVNHQSVDEDLKRALLQNVATQHTELVRLVALLSDEERELADRYADRLSQFQDTLQDTDGYLKMDPTYDAIRALMLDRETLIRALQYKVVNLG